METDPVTATLRRGLIGMISGDETHRRTNEKPTQPALKAYGLTATSGAKDGTNGSETHRERRTVLAVVAAPMVPGLRRHRRCRRRLRPATRRMDMRTLGARAQRARLQAGQRPGSSNLRVALPRRPVPLRLQRPVGRVGCVGGAAVLAAARPRTLPREASLVLALPSEPGCLFGCVALRRAGHGYSAFRRTNSADGPACGKGASSRSRGARTSDRLRRGGGEGGRVPLQPPPGQPRRPGVLPVLAPHDGEPRHLIGARGPLRRVGFFARGAQAAGGLWRRLRALPESCAVSGPRAPKRLGTYNRLIRSSASFRRHQMLDLLYRPGQGNRGLP